MSEEPKIAVYAICKNEEKFVDRWVHSLSEADHIFVLDTGSTDNTVKKFKKYNDLVTIKQKQIIPWHFGNARNEALKMVPDDYMICVIADLDHIFRHGWAKLLKNAFKQGYHEVYGPIIDYDDDNHEIKRFLSKNVHLHNRHWWWERPIHEGIIFHPDNEIQEFNSCEIHEFVIEHHPDRSKSRDGYLDLLEAEYKENSKDPLCAIYYGCELSFHGKDDEANDVFLKALEECDFTDHQDIYYMINLNIACYYRDTNKPAEMKKYLDNASNTGIETKKLYMMYAMYAELDNTMNCEASAIICIKKAMSIPLNESWLEDDYFNKGGCYNYMIKNIMHYIFKRKAIKEYTDYSAAFEKCLIDEFKIIEGTLAVLAYSSLLDDCKSIDHTYADEAKKACIDLFKNEMIFKLRGKIYE